MQFLRVVVLRPSMGYSSEMFMLHTKLTDCGCWAQVF